MLKIKNSKGSRPVRILRTIVIVLVVAGLLVAGGFFAYRWYEDKYGGVPQSSIVIRKTVESAETPAVASDATPGKFTAKLKSVTSSVTPGGVAQVNVQSDVGATCTIKVDYGMGAQKISASGPGLEQKTVGQTGIVVWSWGVSPSTPEGNAQAEVKCTDGKESKTVVGSFIIQKS